MTVKGFKVDISATHSFSRVAETYVRTRPMDPSYVVGHPVGTKNSNGNLCTPCGR